MNCLHFWLIAIAWWWDKVSGREHVTNFITFKRLVLSWILCCTWKIGVISISLTCCLFTCCECEIPSINQYVQSVNPSRWHNLKAFSLVSFHPCSFFLFLFSRSTCHSLFMKTFAYFWVVAVVIWIVKTKVLVNWIAGSHLGCLESLLFWRCHFLSWKAVCWRYVFAILFLDQHSFVVRLTELLYGTLICNSITII